MVPLTLGEVWAEAVSRVVQAEERVVGPGGEEEGSQGVETTSIVQPAVQGHPVSAGIYSRRELGLGELLIIYNVLFNSLL